MSDWRKAGPEHVDERNWFYDQPDGVLFVHEVVGTDRKYRQTDQFVVPWHLLRVALTRHDRKKLPRRKRAA